MIVVEPIAIPVTIPVLDVMVATEGVLLVHVPPAAVSDNTLVPLEHTASVPVIVPAEGNPVTSTSLVALTAPHEPVTV